MTNEEIVVRLTDHDNEIGSLKHRMNAAEQATQAMNRLATAVEVMATKQDTMSDSVNKLTDKVDMLESKPAKRWDGMVDKLIFGLAGAFIAWIAAGAPGL